MYTDKKRGQMTSANVFMKASALTAASVFLIGNALPVLAETATCPNLYNAALPLNELDEKTVEQIILSPTSSPKGEEVAASPRVEELDSATSAATIDSATTSAETTPAFQDKLSNTDPRKDSKDGDLKSRVSLGLPAGSILDSVDKEAAAQGGGPIVVDNDQAKETEDTIKYKELPTDDGGTKVLIGATFPVVLCSQVTSKTAKVGDPVEAHLKYDLKVKDRLVAQKGSLVRGHLDYVLKARSVMHSLVSPTRWYRNSGCVGVCFDELINEKGEHIPLVAKPAQTARIVKNKYEGRVLGVNHNGQVTGPWSQQLRYKAIRIGLNAAMAPAGVFSFGAMPVALGVIGAVNPSFAFMKPVGQNVRHRRIKGFAWGFLSGVPGSWLIEDTVVKGQEAVMMPGDELLAEFKQEFTGEPVTDANLMPGANTKVHGQVVPQEEDKK
jgi:hypothetical protein